MTDHEKPPPIPAFALAVDAPLTLQVRQTGDIEVHCYQAISGSSTPILMKLVFSPKASGDLLKMIQALGESGVPVGGETPGAIQ